MLILYELHGSHWGGCGALLEPINDPQVHCSYYLIVGKVMKIFTWNECTLDAIKVAKFTKDAAPMKWF